VTTVPSVADLLVLEEHANADARCIRVSLKPEAGRAELIRDLAVDIVSRLAAPVPDTFNQWLAHLNGGPPLDQASKEVMLAYVGADFWNEADVTRLEGTVVEHLWASIAAVLEGGWGPPLHVEHDHFSVIDHGPDGLSIYDINGSDLAFRLWESKRHAADSAVTKTITGAARQLRDSGAQYLARMSKVLQTNPSPSIAHLGGTIVRAWTERQTTSGVGVSVGRSAGGVTPDRPFIGLRRIFKFDDPARREGVLIEVPDLAEFAQQVRATVLNGLD
jgi:hypothetical protein